MTLIVPKLSAAAVARYYGLPVRRFQRWVRGTPNVDGLLGTLDSPAIRSTVASFRAGANFVGAARGLDGERVDGERPEEGWSPGLAEVVR